MSVLRIARPFPHAGGSYFNKRVLLSICGALVPAAILSAQGHNRALGSCLWRRVLYCSSERRCRLQNGRRREPGHDHDDGTAGWATRGTSPSLLRCVCAVR